MAWRACSTPATCCTTPALKSPAMPERPETRAREGDCSPPSPTSCCAHSMRCAMHTMPHSVSSSCRMRAAAAASASKAAAIWAGEESTPSPEAPEPGTWVVAAADAAAEAGAAAAKPPPPPPPPEPTDDPRLWPLPGLTLLEAPGDVNRPLAVAAVPMRGLLPSAVLAPATLANPPRPTLGARPGVVDRELGRAPAPAPLLPLVVPLLAPAPPFTGRSSPEPDADPEPDVEFREPTFKPGSSSLPGRRPSPSWVPAKGPITAAPAAAQAVVSASPA